MGWLLPTVDVVCASRVAGCSAASRSLISCFSSELLGKTSNFVVWLVCYVRCTRQFLTGFLATVTFFVVYCFNFRFYLSASRLNRVYSEKVNFYYNFGLQPISVSFSYSKLDRLYSYYTHG